MKIRINEITDWEEDDWVMDGDASHEGDRAVEQLLEEERVEKLDNEWTKGLPFVCNARNIDVALEKYNNKFCEYDYLKAADADWEEIDEA